MKIETLLLKDTNCYLLESDNAAVVIDPGYESKETETFFEKNNDKEKLILITHAHFDHIGGADALRKKCGVKIAIGELDNPALADPVVNEGQSCDVVVKPFFADIAVKDGDVITVGDISLKAYHTPGHTVGGMCYYIDGVLFTGDTLFCKAFGNTCFHGGSRRDIVKSVKGIIAGFPDETVVYSGHGEVTTIGDERRHYRL